MSKESVSLKLDQLENKLKKLLNEHEQLKENYFLQIEENKQLKNKLFESEERFRNFQNQDKISKIASVFSEDKKNLAEFKLKINEYIREIRGWPILINCSGSEIMGVLSIKIRIGDRDYPIKVEESDEEMIRNAAKILNEKLRSFKEAYKIEDKLDLLAMVAFDGLVQKLKADQDQLAGELHVSERLEHLSGMISKAIAE